MVLGRRKFLSLTAQGAAALGALGFGYAMYARREKRALIDDSRPWDMSPDERFPVFDGNKQGPDRRPNIVLIVSDCWRADHFTPAITPKLWRLAERGRRYERFFTNAGFTRASVASYLSGRLPVFNPGDTAHNAIGFRHLSPTGELRIGRLGELIPEDFQTFPEVLRVTGGYRTICATQNQMATVWGGYGKKQWNHIQQMDLLGYSRGGDALAKMALGLVRALRDAKKNEPHFLYAHFVDAHQPYHRTSLSAAEIARQDDYFKTRENGDLKKRERLLPEMKRKYLGGVRFLDSVIADLVEELSAYDKGRRDTVILITADHGEMFNETGEVWNVGHTGYVPPETVHVPLVVVGGGVKPAVVSGLRDAVSLAPTILRIAGILPLDHMDTNDLLAGGSKERIPLLSPYETGEATLSATGAPVITRAPLT